MLWNEGLLIKFHLIGKTGNIFNGVKDFLEMKNLFRTQGECV